jgi:hypothetical protein
VVPASYQTKVLLICLAANIAGLGRPLLAVMLKLGNRWEDELTSELRGVDFCD